MFLNEQYPESAQYLSGSQYKNEIESSEKE
ncbi:hypothetical protein clem_13735 [Legionella clemsonensis]|uniref:Uncharacterized protein n=1 Tax=Legionella clemsonensis TaxID=1867846 RepID=A0A222P5Z2_9GAMM|nr:hypothetical protein clem_13735 [Legionella clemsonensis]